MTPRRQQILDTAAELFAARGFHGVSVAEIGSACGISGPALYKHFSGKEELLSQMLVTISEQLLAEGRARVADADDPDAALVALIDWHVDFAVRHRALIVVQDRDWATLPDAARERVRTLQRDYVDLWADTLQRLDAGLDLATARAKAHAAFGLINSAPHSSLLPEAELRPLLAGMATAALAPAILDR